MKNQNKIILITFLLGFGMGIIFTSLLNFLYPSIEYKKYTKEDIKRMAKELGMVDIEGYIPFIEKTDTTVGNINEIDSMNESENESNEKDYITFKIIKGEKSEEIIERLYDYGIIKDKKEFQRLIVKRNAERRLIYGTYKIRKNITNEELLNLLCGF